MYGVRSPAALGILRDKGNSSSCVVKLDHGLVQNKDRQPDKIRENEEHIYYGNNDVRYGLQESDEYEYYIGDIASDNNNKNYKGDEGTSNGDDEILRNFPLALLLTFLLLWLRVSLTLIPTVPSSPLSRKHHLAPCFTPTIYLRSPPIWLSRPLSPLRRRRTTLSALCLILDSNPYALPALLYSEMHRPDDYGDGDGDGDDDSDSDRWWRASAYKKDRGFR